MTNYNYSFTHIRAETVRDIRQRTALLSEVTSLSGARIRWSSLLETLRRQDNDNEQTVNGRLIYYIQATPGLG